VLLTILGNYQDPERPYMGIECGLAWELITELRHDKDRCFNVIVGLWVKRRNLV